ncbi:MAG: M23 family metallopeptidase [Synechococcaceae cyanobacterium]|nr:M23 family metallopeptidase [Synechococcaceae cyanobacterium]
MACSESGLRPGLARLATLLALALLLADGAAARARSRQAWLRGVFPVASFAGYTSGYGMRFHPISGGSRHHDGIDIAAPLGSPILSWWGGTVVEVIADGGCGNGLVIRSGDYEHIYCHLAGESDGSSYRSGSVWIAVGQRVRSGQLIGHVGLSGSTTGPHLHWGIRYRGVSMNPARILQAMAASRRRGGGPSLGRAPNVGQFR